MEYTHYVLGKDGKVIGLAGKVETVDEFISFAFVYVFGNEKEAEFGYVANCKLLPLKAPVPEGEARALEEAVV